MKSDCNIVTDSAFEERMSNWRRTVIYSGKHNSNCAWWAEMYVRLQRLKGQGDDGVSHSINYVNYKDGWQVENAWRALEDINEKMVLKYWFVLQYPEHRIKRQLLIRRKGVRELLAKAKSNLKKELDNLAQSKLDK